VWTHFIGFVIFAFLTFQLANYVGHEHAFDFPHHFRSHSIATVLADVHAYNFTDSTHPWEFEHFAHEKITEMKGYIYSVKNQIQHKMDSMHHKMDTYLKEIEKSVHDLQNFHPHFPVTNFKANLQSMNTHLHEQFNKFIAPKSKLPMVVFLASAMICFFGVSVVPHVRLSESACVLFFPQA
jgi:PKD repeat protein